MHALCMDWIFSSFSRLLLKLHISCICYFSRHVALQLAKIRICSFYNSTYIYEAITTVCFFAFVSQAGKKNVSNETNTCNLTRPTLMIREEKKSEKKILWKKWASIIVYKKKSRLSYWNKNILKRTNAKNQMQTTQYNYE